MLHRCVVSVYSGSVCTVCGPAHVVDAIGLLFNVLAFTYSTATFVYAYIGRWSAHLVCTLDGLLVFFFCCLHMKGETHSALI